MILVKICRLGSEVKEYSLEDGSTVSSALRAANITYQGCEVNGNSANENTRLNNNDRIFIGSKVKGNVDIVEVKLTKIGAETATYTAQPGQTLDEFVKGLGSTDRAKYVDANGNHIYDYTDMSGNKIESESFRLNAMTSAVRIMLSKKVKGNE